MEVLYVLVTLDLQKSRTISFTIFELQVSWEHCCAQKKFLENYNDFIIGIVSENICSL